MKRGLILLLAVCTLAAAMVPREKRAVNTEEDEERLRKESANNGREKCAPQTACKWILYNSGVSHEDMLIWNTYCVCSADKECTFIERDTSISAYVYRCRTPAGPDTDGSVADGSTALNS